MNYTEYLARFPESTKIGEALTDDESTVFHDTGSSVGCWRVNRGNTVGKGEILSEEDADACRAWCKRVTEQQQRERKR